MRAVVCGGAGFIGSALVDRLLAEGYEVLVIDNLSTGKRVNVSSTAKLVIADIASQSAYLSIVDFKPTTVFHLAAQASVASSMLDPVLDAGSNVVGLLNVLLAAVAAEARKMIFATSGGTIYGDANLPTAEDQLYRSHPRSFYGISKRVAIDYLRVFNEQTGLEWCALALGNVYGPRQDPYGESGVVAKFANALLMNDACCIYGDGKTSRDFIHVDDVVDAFLSAGDRGHGVMNIAAGVDVSVLEIYRELAKSFPNAKPARFMERLPGEVRRVRLSIDRARQQLQWGPSTKLADGIASYAQYLKNINRTGRHSRASESK